MNYQYYKNWKEISIQATPLLSVVIPAFNEENRIVPTIGAVAAHVSDMELPWELIIADDGSNDGTVDLLTSLDLANMVVLTTNQNQGKGSAVQRGVLAARGKFILIIDADNSTPIEELNKLFREMILDGSDLVVGSRAIEGANEEDKSLYRHIISFGLRLLVRTLFNVNVKDTQCGFKLYRRDAALKLHRSQTVTGFSFDLEILFLAKKYGYQISEVPVEWIDAPGSTVDTFKEIWRFLFNMLKIKTNDINGIYVGV